MMIYGTIFLPFFVWKGGGGGGGWHGAAGGIIFHRPLILFFQEICSDR